MTITKHQMLYVAFGFLLFSHILIFSLGYSYGYQSGFTQAIGQVESGLKEGSREGREFRITGMKIKFMPVRGER